MLYVLRHGEIQRNRLGRFQGQQNSPLTERGEWQAAAMGRLLGHHLVDPSSRPIWCSPLGRKQQSCSQVCAALDIGQDVVRNNDAFKKVNFSIREGLTATEVALLDHAIYDHRNRDKFLNPALEGESYRDVFERVSAWLGTIDSGRRTVVIAHGSLNQMPVGAATGIASKRCLKEVPPPQDALLEVTEGR